MLHYDVFLRVLSLTGWLSSNEWWSLKMSRRGLSPHLSTSSSERRPTSRNFSSWLKAQTAGTQQWRESTKCTQRSVMIGRSDSRTVANYVQWRSVFSRITSLSRRFLYRYLDFARVSLKYGLQSGLTNRRSVLSDHMYGHSDVTLPSPSHRWPREPPLWRPAGTSVSTMLRIPSITQLAASLSMHTSRRTRSTWCVGAAWQCFSSCFVLAVFAPVSGLSVLLPMCVAARWRS